MGRDGGLETAKDVRPAKAEPEPLTLAMLMDDPPKGFSSGRPHVVPSQTVKGRRDAADIKPQRVQPDAPVEHRLELATVSQAITNSATLQTTTRDIQHILQNSNIERPAGGASKTLSLLNAELSRQAGPQGQTYRLDATQNGNNWHLNLIDTSVTMTPGQPEQRLFQGSSQAGGGRRAVLNELANSYRNAALKDDLDVNVNLTPVKSDLLDDAARNAGTKIKTQAAAYIQWSRNPRGPQPELLSQSFMNPFMDTALASRTKFDRNGAEIVQTALIDLNRSLRDTNLSVNLASPVNGQMSRELAEWCQQNPYAIPLQIVERGKNGAPQVVGEYAYNAIEALKTPNDQATPLKAVSNRIAESGTFTDPNGGINRRAEYDAMVQIFDSQLDKQAFVDEINKDLAARQSKFHIAFTRVAPNNPWQVTILDERNRQREYIQLRSR